MKNSAYLYSIVNARAAQPMRPGAVVHTMAAAVEAIGRDAILHALILAIVVAVALATILSGISSVGGVR